MEIIVGLICAGTALLYAGQLITTINLTLTQRLGLQETPASFDPLIGRLELNAG